MFMDLNILQQIKEIIQNADQVLIGIGEDWNLLCRKSAEADLESDYRSVLALDEVNDNNKRIMNAYECLYELVKDLRECQDAIRQLGY